MKDTRDNDHPAADPIAWGVTAAEARQLLQNQICPICSAGPWQSPLNHVARKHGIDRHTMRDICLLTVDDVVTTSDLHERIRANSLGNDMSSVTAASRASTGPKRMTNAGKQNLTHNLAHVTAEQSRAALALAHTPEARAKQAATSRAKWAAMSAEQRQSATAHLRRTPEQLSAQSRESWDKKGRQPCGTRASYRRGCRCEACRSAYLVYKRDESRARREPSR